MNAKLALGVLAVVAVTTGCGRKVVVHPDKLATKSDAAWRVTSEPGSATGAAPASSGAAGTPNLPPSAPLPPSSPPR